MKESKILNELKEKIIRLSMNIPAHRFVIKSVDTIKAFFKPTSRDVVLKDTIIVVQTEGSGSCCCFGEIPKPREEIIGQDARFFCADNLNLAIAVLDSAYSVLKSDPYINSFLQGNSEIKANARSTVILNELLNVSYGIKPSQVRLAVVGAMGNIIEKTSNIGWKIYATDLDPDVIGQNFNNIKVEDGGEKTLLRVSQSNIALVTGMALATNTLENILKTAKENNVKVVIYAQTGSSFAYEYLKFGAESVISESYPFYMFPGLTHLRVFRK